MTRRPSMFPFKLFTRTTVVLVITLVSAAPVLAGKRSCNELGSLRSSAADMTSTIEITNRRSTPTTVELVGGSDATKIILTLAPGENRPLQSYRSYTWVSRDARRRCLSSFVSEEKWETWELTADVDGDYERKNVRSFPVYVAPEFRSHESSLLEKSLQVLDSNVRRIEEVLPSAAWQKISRIPIWLEYEPDRSYGGVYFFASQEWLAANGISIAKAGSIQFTSSLAVMIGNQLNPLMHELAHAYHDLVLSYSYPRIRAAFERARASGRYNSVRHVSGRLERAYAMTDHMEFFAELSEAYFGTNDFFPFTRDDLKEFDPSSYRAISDAWGRPFEASSGWRAGPAAWPLGTPK
jgi:hypothetical protein